MNLHRLTQADEFEVRDWLEQELSLTTYQIEKLLDRDFIRLSPFYFYKHTKQPKSSFLWRLTLPAFLLFLILLIIFLPVRWFFTGQWGYGFGIYDKFYAPWKRKLT